MSKEFDRIKQTMNDEYMADLRDSKNYELVYHDYPFGRRCALKLRDQRKYEDLQASRGVKFGRVQTIDELKVETEFLSADFVRVKELEAFSDRIFANDKDFLELGFRTPRLLEFYKSKFRNVRGCDVVDLNVEVAQRAGYNVEKCDLNDPSALDMSGVLFFVAYHVLEHVFDPLKTICVLFQKADAGSYFHVEIPIEPGIPRVRYSHVYAFHSGDLVAMLKFAGFKIVLLETNPCPGGPQIERVLAYKE